MHFVSSKTRSRILRAAAGSMGTGGISDAAARSSDGIGSIIADRWDPRDHFVQIARIDRGRFSDLIVARQRSNGLVCALQTK